MDVFSHGLWGVALVYPKTKLGTTWKIVGVSLGAGMLPDIISFLPVQLYFLLTGFAFDPSLFFPMPQHWVFSFAIQSYNYTHSLVIFLAMLGVFLLYKKKYVWFLLPWGLHILMDLFTHPDFFQTPFLFPFSNFKLQGVGVSWAEPWLFFSNWAVLSFVFIVILLVRRNRRQAELKKA